jgi:4-hydroxyproline epimerase
MASNTYLCIDGHTCGCPVRLVAGGGPQLQGKTMSERRQYFLNNFEELRLGAHGADVRAARP